MPQLQAYHRPTTITDALQLLLRQGINTAIIAGGTKIVATKGDMVNEIVDLQALGLTEVNYTGKGLSLGAMVRLQTIVDDDRSPKLLRTAVLQEGANTFRNAATIGGILAKAGKDSQLLATLLVFEAQVNIQTIDGPKTIPLVDFLRDVPSALNGGVLTSVFMKTMGKTAHAQVARTPADTPIVAVMARLADDGKIHLALSGVANTPILVDPDNVKAAVNPTNDFRGSTEYRRQMAAILTKRVVAEVTNK